MAEQRGREPQRFGGPHGRRPRVMRRLAARARVVAGVGRCQDPERQRAVVQGGGIGPGREQRPLAGQRIGGTAGRRQRQPAIDRLPAEMTLPVLGGGGRVGAGADAQHHQLQHPRRWFGQRDAQGHAGALGFQERGHPERIGIHRRAAGHAGLGRIGRQRQRLADQVGRLRADRRCLQRIDPGVGDETLGQQARARRARITGRPRRQAAQRALAGEVQRARGADIARQPQPEVEHLRGVAGGFQRFAELLPGAAFDVGHAGVVAVDVDFVGEDPHQQRVVLVAGLQPHRQQSERPAAGQRRRCDRVARLRAFAE